MDELILRVVVITILTMSSFHGAPILHLAQEFNLFLDMHMMFVQLLLKTKMENVLYIIHCLVGDCLKKPVVH